MAQQPLRVLSVLSILVFTFLAVVAGGEQAQVFPAFNLTENSILITDMPSSRLIRVTDLSSTGWQEGPTTSGVSLNWPWHFSLDSSGKVYIADRDNGRIVRIDDLSGAGWTIFNGIAGNPLVQSPFTTGNVGAGNFISSTTVDSLGRIYATTNGRLVRIDDITGTGWTTFTNNVRGLKSVAVDQQGRIYLSDNYYHWIARMNDMQGTGWVTYGSHGNGVGQFNEPEGLTFDSQGRIYITDETNHQIVRINDMTGAGWTTFGSFGSGVGQFSLPHDVQVDSLGRIYIVDTGNWRVVRINSMKGDGWVAFGANGCTVCTSGPMLGPFLFEAPKAIRVLGTGPLLTYRAVFPQVAVGGAYRTSIVGINTGTSSVDGEFSFTKAGAPCQPGFPFACGVSLPVTVDDVSASEFQRRIAPMGIARLEAGSAGSLTSGYARMRSLDELQGIALFQAMSGDTVVSQAGVGLSTPSRHFTIYIDNLNNAQTGYALANPLPEGLPTNVANGQGRINLTMTLRDKAGTILESITTNVGPGAHFAEFASQRFPARAGPGFEGSIEFSGPGKDEFQAVALRYDNAEQDVFTTVPVVHNTDDPNKDPQIHAGAHTTIPRVGTRTLYFPQVADGSSYRTNFILVNATDTATTATLEFFSRDGAPLSLPVGGVQRTSLSVQLNAYGVARLLTDGTSPGIETGWARVTSPTDLGGSAIFQTVVGGRITSEAGVQSSPLVSRIATYVSTLGFTDSGVAVANPGNSSVNVTFNLRNVSGQIVASTTRTLLARGHTAQMLSQMFPSGYSDFEGTLEVLGNGASISGVALRYDNPGGTVFAATPVIAIP